MKQLLAHLIRVSMVLLLFSANLSLAGVRWCTLGVADAREDVSSCCHQTAKQDGPVRDEGGCCCTDLPAPWSDALSERPSEASAASVAIVSPKPLTHPPLFLNSLRPTTVPRVVPRRYLRICALLL
ncbi:MAG: hypothetical protein ACI8W8_002503 [Rhodothermales bacterium]|jgi:hypothetical protein